MTKGRIINPRCIQILHFSFHLHLLPTQNDALHHNINDSKSIKIERNIKHSMCQGKKAAYGVFYYIISIALF